MHQFAVEWLTVIWLSDTAERNNQPIVKYINAVVVVSVLEKNRAVYMWWKESNKDLVVSVERKP